MTSNDNDFGSVHSEIEEQRIRTKDEIDGSEIYETSISLAGPTLSQNLNNNSQGMEDSESLNSFASKLGDVEDERRGRCNTYYEDVDQVSQRGSVVSAIEFDNDGRTGSVVSALGFSSDDRNDSIASAIENYDQFERNGHSNFQSARIDEFDRKDNNNFSSAREYGISNPAFRNNTQDTTVGNHIGHSSRPSQSAVGEGGLMQANPRICNFFTYTGMYHLRWNSDHYEVREGWFILAYFMWFLVPMVGFIIAYVGYKVWGYDVDRDLNDIWATSLVVLALAVVPAIQTYTIRIFNDNLPSVLKDITLIDSDQRFKNIKSGSHVNILKMKFGLLPRSCQFNLHSLYKKVPEITFLLAGITFAITFTVGIVDSTESEYVFREWPFLVMMVFYLFLPVLSTWFCLIFIDWQKVCYKKIYKDMKKEEGTLVTGLRQAQDTLALAPILDSKNLIVLSQYFDKVQDVFEDMKEKIFSYVLGVNVLIFLISSIFCASRMMKSFEFIFYVIPLFLSIYHLFIMCDRCSNLRKKHGMILAELKRVLQSLEKMDNADAGQREWINSLHRFRENLHDSPPQVTVLGAFTMDYGMLTTVIGFIISYALIINELFDDTIICTLPENNSTQMVYE